MATALNNPLPLDLQMDLLVDAELPEAHRRDLLLAIDKNPAQWRDLAIRFLERQVERRSTHEFVGLQKAATNDQQPPSSHRAWWTGTIPQTAAAGLMILIIAGALLLVGSRQKSTPPIPVTAAHNLDQPFFPAQNAIDLAYPSKRSVVIQPDGNGNAVVIPVNTLPMKFY